MFMSSMVKIFSRSERRNFPYHELSEMENYIFHRMKIFLLFGTNKF